jgi:TatD DNase family protein
MTYVDTHCHLDAAAFDADRAATLQRAADAGVTDIMLPGVHPRSFTRLLDLQAECGVVRLHTAFGLHPQLLPELPPEQDDVILAAIAEMCVKHRPLAIGECGLDHRVDSRLAPHARQRRVLAFHLQLARRLELPVLLHCLSAHEDLAQELDAAGELPQGGVMHSFSGSAEQMMQFVQRGLHISFAGPITWPGARKAPRCAAVCPPERLLAETDAPDQAPEPVRGQRNEPANMVHVVAALARARQETEQDTAALCVGNARRLLGLP